MSLSSFHYFFSLFCFFYIVSLFLSKILHFIPFRVYYILLKQKSKQNPSKMQSKHLSKTENRVANVANIILSYTLIGYKFAVSLFASVLLQLLLKQIRKQNPSKRISKSNDVVSQSTLRNSPTCPFCLVHGFCNR